MLSSIFVSSLFTAVLANPKLVRRDTCVATEASQIAAAVASCTEITLQDIAAPDGQAIDLSDLKPNSVVTFAGLTTFGFVDSKDFVPITAGGKNVTITCVSGAIIDGNGQAYWDGLGSNGGANKPNHFFKVTEMTGGSVIKNLFIRNWPAHGFYISGSSDLTLRDMILDNSAGDAPNDRSDGKEAAHNSDGFGIASSNNTLISNCRVINQDDCVAVTSGDNITVEKMYCSGTHGLSIGSIGGKANNVVTNILFQDSEIVNSENGARIKTNEGTTGTIANITYKNIVMNNITKYGIDVQQDYLNGGPTGNPSNSVSISNVLFQNVTGTVQAQAHNYYVLCGDGSCSNFEFKDVKITGGEDGTECNYPPSGCPA
ncbi:Polygalacturonase [Lachnellula suecica]|uniref:endo-polygalacturonase n=1 Tax=Lachnellula suecica TaxID=602035 RepID=A0A8T9CJC5_9HELO|nr:Polygalacturonase [Lachnellula suecica]